MTCSTKKMARCKCIAKKGIADANLIAIKECGGMGIRKRRTIEQLRLHLEIMHV